MIRNIKANQSELISIVIPVYNAEKYIDKCLKSVLNQTYENFEILLINDGSIDKSKSICEKYAKKYKKITLYSQNNSGPSKARNTGIENSKGDYIIFIDADDYIKENMLEVLYYNAIHYNADISMCNVKRVNEKGNTIKDVKKYKQGIIEYNGKEFRANMEDPRGYYTFAVNKLIRKSIIKKVRFRENIYYNEDGLFYYELSENVKKAIYDSNQFLYHYISHPTTATKKGFNDKYLTVLDSFAIINKYYNDFNETNKKIFAYKYVNHAIRAKYYLIINNHLPQENYKVDKIINDYYPEAIKCDLITGLEKAKFYLKLKYTRVYYLIKAKLKKGKIWWKLI